MTAIKRWTMPRDYGGETWYEHYSAGVGQSRDSDALERSNFRTMLKYLGGESETVIVVRERHWAVGWVEWIAIHETDVAAIAIASTAVARLDDYPILDEIDFVELEMEEETYETNN